MTVDIKTKQHEPDPEMRLILQREFNAFLWNFQETEGVRVGNGSLFALGMDIIAAAAGAVYGKEEGINLTERLQKMVDEWTASLIERGMV